MEERRISGGTARTVAGDEVHRGGGPPPRRRCTRGEDAQRSASHQSTGYQGISVRRARRRAEPRARPPLRDRRRSPAAAAPLRRVAPHIPGAVRTSPPHSRSGIQTLSRERQLANSRTPVHSSGDSAGSRRARRNGGIRSSGWLFLTIAGPLRTTRQDHVRTPVGTHPARRDLRTRSTPRLRRILHGRIGDEGHPRRAGASPPPRTPYHPSPPRQLAELRGPTHRPGQPSAGQRPCHGCTGGPTDRDRRCRVHPANWRTTWPPASRTTHSSATCRPPPW